MIKRRSRRNGVAFLCSFVAGILYFGSKTARTAVNVRFPFLRDGPVRQDSELTKTRLRAKCGVITTILEVNDAVRYIASNLNASLIVIGDQRTNHTEWHAFQREHAGVVLYLPPAEQVGLPFRILRHIPWNHFGRKSIGFLYAVAGGCHQIYDFDDDNHLKKPEGFERVSSWAMYELGSTSQTVHVFNPYPYFQPTDDSLVVWPRGFPLQFINDNRTYDVTSDAFDVKRLDGADFENIAVLQSLADHDPDVDAIYRMTRQLPISFQRQKTILIPPRAVYTPWNAQAVLVSNPAFFGLLLPVTVTGRVSDIWRSYITTRLLWETRYRVAFTSPFVTQYRNPHSYIVDFADEDDLYNKVDDLLEALAIWTSDGHDSLETAYIDLITKLVREVEILGETDLRLAKAWVEDLKAIGYVWPAMHERVSAVGCCQKAAIVDQRQVHTFRDLSVNGGNVVNENQTSHSHSPSDENRAISDKRYHTTQTISVSKVERKNAVCIFGISEVNTIPGWKRHVLDQLSADLYVIQDSKNELIQRYAESVGARLFRVNMTLVHFFDKHAPKWNESASGNYLGGLPGPFEKRGAYLLRDRFLCEQHISSHETRAGRKYKFIGLGRADLLWLLPHPKLSPRGCWIPCTNNDWGGVCDHWAWCDRQSPRKYMQSPLANLPRNTPMNAEKHLKTSLNESSVAITRGHAAFVRSCRTNATACVAMTESNGLIYAKPSGGQIEYAKDLLLGYTMKRAYDEDDSANTNEFTGSIKARSLNRVQLAYDPPAVNMVSGEVFKHHPVFQTVHALRETYPVQNSVLTELNGILVPAEFDCEIFNNNSRWGTHPYFWAVPSRWYACRLHHANLLSGLRTYSPELPVIDEEYIENIYVFQSVLRAVKQKKFIMVELGARWGTWGTRAVGLWRKVTDKPYDLLFVEPDELHCKGIERVQTLNNITYQLDCSKANSTRLFEWIAKKDHCDLIDVDIQGAELEVLRELKHHLDRYVYRMIIGTHSPKIHRAIRALFEDWIMIHEFSYSSNTQCVSDTLRRNYDPSREQQFRWDELLKKGCFQQTWFGPVANWDGEVIVDNPLFIDRDKVCLVNSSEACDDELL